jgi:hypothetical protein
MPLLFSSSAKTQQVRRVVDAKDGGAGLSDPQKRLNSQGGVFYGSRRFKDVNRGQYKIRPNMIEQQKTDIKNTTHVLQGTKINSL